MCCIFAGLFFLLTSFFWVELGNAGMDDPADNSNRFLARAKMPPLPVGVAQVIAGGFSAEES